MGLAGAGRTIAFLMPCTVVNPDDLAARYLDRQRHPECHGQTSRLVDVFPTNEPLWAQYTEIRRESMRAGGDGREATAFYAEHRAEMDAGAVLNWPERFEPGELSALQYAMNKRVDLGDEAFMAELQNDPLPAANLDPEALTADEVCNRFNGHARGLVPTGCTRLTAGVDVQGQLLYWVVCAWDEGFGGHVVSYGTTPDQGRRDFLLRNCPKPLSALCPEGSLEAQLHAGLEATCQTILARDWPTDAGGMLRVEKCFIDIGWGESKPVVHKFFRSSPFAAVLLPSKNTAITAGKSPMSEWARKEGDRRGLNWVIRAAKPGEPRWVTADAHYWKSFVHARLRVPAGGRGGLYLWGDKPAPHRNFAGHICSEYRTRTVGPHGEVDEWQQRPERPDNHWLDALVMATIAASVQGVALAESAARPRAKPAPIDIGEAYRKARGG